MCIYKFENLKIKIFIHSNIKFIMINYLQKTGSEIVYHFLKNKNINCVFGYTGGAILSLTDKFHEYNNSDIKYIKNINELCVGHSAEGYAKVTDKPGIILTTSGPGVTNLITPLQNALTDGTPLIAFSGQVPTDAIGTEAFQECPSIELTKACTKWNHRVEDINNLPDVLNFAFDVSMSGRKGPVFIDLPKDILSQEVYDTSSINFYKDIAKYTENRFLYNTAEKNINKFLELLYKAKRPILYIGQGALGAVDEIREFIDKKNIPYTTTIHGLGIGDEHKCNSMHMLGMHGSVYANKSIQKSDLIIAIGCRFDDRTTGNLKYYAPEARLAEKEKRGGIIHFNIDEKQINKTVKSTMNFPGDCKYYLKHILNICDETKINIVDWNIEVVTLKKKHPFQYTKSETRLKVQEVIEKIYHCSKEHKPYISTGVGNHQMYTAQFFRWDTPGRMITSGSLGTMGFGLPSAIGVQLAHPDDLVILIDGDGSFGMTQNDLSTVAEHNLPIKMFIMNDSRQQMVYIWQKLFFNEKYISTDNYNPDFNKLADAYGIKNIILEKNNLNDIVSVLNTPGPVLVNCIVEPDLCTPLVAPGKALDDMILNSTNLHIKGEAPS